MQHHNQFDHQLQHHESDQLGFSIGHVASQFTNHHHNHQHNIQESSQEDTVTTAFDMQLVDTNTAKELDYILQNLNELSKQQVGDTNSNMNQIQSKLLLLCYVGTLTNFDFSLRVAL